MRNLGLRCHALIPLKEPLQFPNALSLCLPGPSVFPSAPTHCCPQSSYRRSRQNFESYTFMCSEIPQTERLILDNIRTVLFHHFQFYSVPFYFQSKGHFTRRNNFFKINNISSTDNSPCFKGDIFLDVIVLLFSILFYKSRLFYLKKQNEQKIIINDKNSLNRSFYLF